MATKPLLIPAGGDATAPAPAPLPLPEKDVHCQGLQPRFLGGTLEIPVYHVRGGTSTGAVFYKNHLPEPRHLAEEVLRRVMGVPEPTTSTGGGGAQLTGLGRDKTTSNKVFIIGTSNLPDVDFESTFAQLAANKSTVDWSVNCGNMTSALPTVAYDIGLAQIPSAGDSGGGASSASASGSGDVAESGNHTVRIFNTNTRKMLLATTPLPRATCNASIHGVQGRWPGVQVAFVDPAGARTGMLLPDRSHGPTSTCPHPNASANKSIDVTCIDVTGPMMILRAADLDLGLDVSESKAALDANPELKAALCHIRAELGTQIGLATTDGKPLSKQELADSMTVPKMLIVGKPSEAEQKAGVRDL